MCSRWCRAAVLNPQAACGLSRIGMRPTMLNVTVLCVEHNNKIKFSFLHSFKHVLNKYKLMFLLCKIIEFFICYFQT